MEDRSIVLTTKPGASLRISIHLTETNHNPLSNTLLLFLNGLVLPRSAWSPAISHLLSTRAQSNSPIPNILTYDRYGQGDSDPDPTDHDSKTNPYGHDVLSVIADLHQLLAQLSFNSPQTRLLIVANSIGCPLARLFLTTPTHTTTLSSSPSLLFLDSMISNTDFVSLFPNPDSPSFDPAAIPPNISAHDLRHAREQFKTYFHPSVPNPERLDRRNLQQLLPHADKPKLLSSSSSSLSSESESKKQLIVIIGHDWDEFADQCEKGSLSVSKAVINAYLNPAWAKYNEGLTTLLTPAGSEPDQKTKVKIAKGCGHFIQRDDPVFVAREINNLLNGLLQP